MYSESPHTPVRGSVPWQVLTLSLLLTCIATYYLLTTAERRERLRFQTQVERAQHLIEDRMEMYLAILRSTSGLFAAQEPVHSEEFRAFVSKLELRERYPGLQGIGFSRRSAPAEMKPLVAAMRRQGIPEFRIWPDHPRPEYHTILFLEPLDRRNRAALGFDMFTEPVRRAAMERARDTGLPALSGRTILVQEIDVKKQPGFLLYVPVYRRGLPVATVEERRFALLGFVYSPFRAGDFLQGVLGPDWPQGIAVAIYAGQEPVSDNLLYRSGAPSHPRFAQAGTFQIAGTPWTLVASSLPSFEASSSFQQAWVVLAAGLLTSAILFGLSRSQVQARMEAEQAASDLTRSEEALRESSERYREVAIDNARLYEAECRARAEAETANQVKDRFMASLSHELRTPLTPVLAVIATLEETARLPPDVSERLATIRRNVELEARLIDDLLDLTRITRGKLELKPEVTELREILGHALDACSPPGSPARERFEIALPEGCDLRLWADAPRLTQVFWNLMTNALKFTPEGGTIRVRADRDEATGEIVAEVSDQGIGIEPQRLPHVFEAFEQGQRSITRQYGGLGLGLAITKAIVELHGGQIEAESAGPGQGATFRIRLPIGAEHLPALPSEPLPERPAAAAPPPEPDDRPLHILLIEDHPDTADAMESLLAAVGHRVTVANNARDALAAAQATEAEREEEPGAGIDLVISDVGLPDLSGLELMTELKSRYHLRGIALSGYGMDEDIQRSREAGFERHLTKPVNLQVLQEAIRQVAWHGD